MAGTDVLMLARDEIAEDVGAFVVGEAEVAVKHVSRGGRHRVFGEQSSPREITGIGGRIVRQNCWRTTEFPPSAPIRRSPVSLVPSSNCAVAVPACGS